MFLGVFRATLTGQGGYLSPFCGFGTCDSSAVNSDPWFSLSLQVCHHLALIPDWKRSISQRSSNCIVLQHGCFIELSPPSCHAGDKNRRRERPGASGDLSNSPGRGGFATTSPGQGGSPAGEHGRKRQTSPELGPSTAVFGAGAWALL